jgi:carbon monoxide dehydrogenase subunit G
MEIKGSYLVSAPPEQVWKALNDPDILGRCIPGIETLEKKSQTEFAATMTAKVGPVKAKFAGQVTFSDLDPPRSYRITGEGQGGVAGFAKGTCVVTLVDSEGETELSYEAEAQVGGKLAQIGSRVVGGVARKMADDFFGAFADQISNGRPLAGKAAERSQLGDDSGETGKSNGQALGPGLWITGLIAIVAVLWWLSS